MLLFIADWVELHAQTIQPHLNRLKYPTHE